jgi:hypothetical protein
VPQTVVAEEDMRLFSLTTLTGCGYLHPGYHHADQRVNVKVIDVDPNKCRLNLSIKQLQPDPLKTTLDTVSRSSSDG